MAGKMWLKSGLFLLLEVAYIIAQETLDKNPRITLQSKDIFARIGSPAALVCEAEGDPLPVITWYKNGGPVETTKDNPYSNKALVIESPYRLKLFFHSILLTDLGVYYCNATSNLGTAISRTISLGIVNAGIQLEPNLASWEDAKQACAASQYTLVPGRRYRAKRLKDLLTEGQSVWLNGWRAVTDFNKGPGGKLKSLKVDVARSVKNGIGFVCQSASGQYTTPAELAPNKKKASKMCMDQGYTLASLDKEDYITAAFDVMTKDTPYWVENVISKETIAKLCLAAKIKKGKLVYVYDTCTKEFNYACLKDKATIDSSNYVVSLKMSVYKDFKIEIEEKKALTTTTVSTTPPTTSTTSPTTSSTTTSPTTSTTRPTTSSSASTTIFITTPIITKLSSTTSSKPVTSTITSTTDSVTLTPIFQTAPNLPRVQTTLKETNVSTPQPTVAITTKLSSVSTVTAKAAVTQSSTDAVSVDLQTEKQALSSTTKFDTITTLVTGSSTTEVKMPTSTIMSSSSALPTVEGTPESTTNVAGIPVYTSDRTTTDIDAKTYVTTTKNKMSDTTIFVTTRSSSSTGNMNENNYTTPVVEIGTKESTQTTTEMEMKTKMDTSTFSESRTDGPIVNFTTQVADKMISDSTSSLYGKTTSPTKTLSTSDYQGYVSNKDNENETTTMTAYPKKSFISTTDSSMSSTTARTDPTEYTSAFNIPKNTVTDTVTPSSTEMLIAIEIDENEMPVTEDTGNGLSDDIKVPEGKLDNGDPDESNAAESTRKGDGDTPKEEWELPLIIAFVIMAVAVIIALLLALYLYRRRKHQKQKDITKESDVEMRPKAAVNGDQKERETATFKDAAYDI